MNKQLHNYAPVLVGTLFGFVIGYAFGFGFRCKCNDADKIKNFHSELKQKFENAFSVKKVCFNYNVSSNENTEQTDNTEQIDNTEQTENGQQTNNGEQNENTESNN